MSGPTAADIEAARTPAGGWTKETLAAWGVSWPPPKGWRKALLANANPAQPFSCNGKQVLLDGQHYADARDERAAADIAFARNRTKCRTRSVSPAAPSIPTTTETGA